MKRFLLTCGILLWLAAPAFSATLLNTPVTTAVTALTTPVFQVRPGPGGRLHPMTMTVQAVLTYGSGGTTALAWLQTSLDGGVTWADVCAFNFATASLKQIANISSATPVATAAITPTDGSNAGPNKCIDGVMGNLWRVKYTTTGTYAGGTTLRIDAIGNGITTSP